MAKLKQKQKTGKNSPLKSILQENKYFVWGMIAAFLLCVISVTTYKIEDDDFFWHLNTGRFIAENGYVPDKDVMGYATQNAEWIPFEWGWDVISYELYKAGGYSLIFFFRSLIFCLIFFIYFRLLNKFKVNSVLSVLLLFTLLLAMLNRLSPRPHIFTYLFLSILIYALFGFRYLNREKYMRYLYIFPLVFLIWANLHLGVFTGILLLLVFIVSEIISYYKHTKSSTGENQPLTVMQIKKLIFIFICSLLVLFINPHGLRTYAYAYGHTNMKMLESIAEWLSPFSSLVEGGIVITLYKILLFAGLIVLIFAYKKGDLTFALIYIVFAVYSIRGIRFTVDYEIIAIPLLALSLNYYLKRLEKSGSFIFKLFYGNGVKSLLTVTLIFLSYQFQTDSFYISLKYNREAGTGISSRYFPVEMVKFIKENNVNGIPFNNFDTGGYLAWEVPGQKIFIDSRNINDKIFDEYISIFNMQPGFKEKLEKYGIDYAYIFDPKLIRFPKILKQCVTEYFFNDSSWALVYWDDESMLFIKERPKYSELKSKFEYKVFNPYTALFNQPKFEENIKYFPLTAEEEIRRKSVSEPEGYFFLGMNEIAQKILKKKNP